MAVVRHINFFELQKACAEPGCPLCCIVAKRADRYMDNLLFEHVSDRGFRAAYRAAGGFCDYHSRGLASFRDGLAVAILGRDILLDRIASFKKNKAWKPKDRCPVCMERERIETEYLGFLSGAEAEDPTKTDEQDLRLAFQASDGLCVPHYASLLSMAKRIPRWLREFQERKFDELLARTSSFIEFSAYGRQEEFKALSEKDKIVWKELAVALRGGLG